ncbi:TonB-dependent receptor [Pedobacter sp. PACM 27299]|uniref:TonB-dependent receptor n=1 Tax=Pedobacter sp. PACM 27299 TaxID=1727164 RepID=UPI001E654D84|nr:TonB-dependent receptor [Pedobacter sp. PACM 27299]
MKLTVILLTVAILQSSAATFAQKVSISTRDTPIKSVLYKLTRQTGFNFIVDAALLEQLKPVTLNVKNESMEEVLKRCFDQRKFEFIFNENETIVIKSRAPLSPSRLINIKGKVTDEKGEPLSGVSISVKGMTISRFTDVNGNFSLINVPADGILIFSFVGKTKKEVVINSRTELNVVMEDQAYNADEVVIVGYGQQKKQSVTGAISTVSGKDLVQSPVANLSNALAGRLSGLTTIQGNGKPGADGSALFIRGIGTYTGNNSPLVMVDGVARDSWDNIDPNEVESISVLKDASATAVYGVRGANGVILIVTKRGKEGEPMIHASAQTAVVQMNRFPKFVNSFEYASLMNEKSFQQYWINHAKDADISTWDDFMKKRDANWIKEAPNYYSEEELLYYKNSKIPKLANGEKNPYYDPYFHPDVDWREQLFKKSAMQSQFNVNVGGGTERVKYFVSLGHLNQGGLFKTDYMPFSEESQYNNRRSNLRANLDFDVNKDFRVSVDIGTQFQTQTGLVDEDWIWNQRVMWTTPLTTPGMIDGKFVMPYTNPKIGDNPLYQISTRDFRVTNSSTLNSLIRLNHKLGFITEGLSANARVAYDSYFSTMTGGRYTPGYYIIKPGENGDISNPKLVMAAEDQAPQRYSDWYNGKWRKIYGEFSLNYSRTFGDHAVSALALYNIEKKFDPNLANKLPHGYLGAVGRATYAYKSRYLGEVNVGYNGSENFPEGMRFGLLPAYSLGWVASNESFFPKNDYLTYLKFRGSLGKVGNDNIGGARYLYLPDTWNYTGGYTFGTLNDRNWVPGAEEGRIGNQHVTWETSTKMNIGLETRFFKDKLSITYDYYNEHRKDILSYKQTVPDIVQASLPPYNLGEVKNWGHELEANFRSNLRNVNYWVKANASTNKNKIVFMDEAIMEGLEYQSATGRPVGQPSYLQADGLYTSWATLYEIDRNGNPVLGKPIRAKNKSGQEYTNAAGNPVYQKDLGYAGVVLQPGEVRLIDVNEDGVIDDKDYMRSGKTAIPEFSYGVAMGFNYKGFDFSILFQGVSGVAKYVNNNRHFNNKESMSEVDLNRFTLERYNNGDQIDFPIAAYSHASSYNTFLLKDASYLRLKNMEIGYSLQPKFLKKVGIRSARIYANGNNLYTWAPSLIWGDPENLGYVGYPITRTYNFGISFNF